ncbi:MAG: DUF128 domain-containing protein [Lentisphaerae bacterium]|nr:DUF128 domain-containing protein [Lentisphaerota bacterium]
MSDKVDRIKASILRALVDAGKPSGAAHIAGALLSMGIEMQPRTVRQYLSQLDDEGLTRLVSRRLGRVLTEEGREAGAQADLTGHLGIVAAKIDTLAYRMSFDLNAGEGTVIANVSFVEPSHFPTLLNEFSLVVERGLAVGRRLAVGQPGERIGSVTVPEGLIGVGTVCSITLNGIIQAHGIPLTSRFGGLLEIRNRQYVRFLNMIEYRASTLDPLEVFVRADMTRVRDVVLRGSGVICASFREVPAAAVPDLRGIVRKASGHDIGGVLEIGKPGQPLFGIPVAGGYCGVVVGGGLNAVAGAIEAGVRIPSRTLSGLEDYGRFVTLQEARRMNVS